MDLPVCDGHNAIFTYIERLTQYFWLIACFVGEGALSASSVAKLFFDNVIRFFGVLDEVISHRYPRFTTSLW